MRRFALPLILATLALAIAPAAAWPGAQAGAASCSTRAGLGAPPAVQEGAMLCLVNAARRGRGLPPLNRESLLSAAAARKSADIIRCEEFTHEACGREFTYWVERLGYDGCAVGENIAWGTGPLGSVRAIFRAWMHSPGHRENVLGPYEQIGIGLRIGALEGNAGAHVWTQELGSPC